MVHLSIVTNFITGTFRVPVLGSTGEKDSKFAFLSSLMKLVQEKSTNRLKDWYNQVRRFRSSWTLHFSSWLKITLGISQTCYYRSAIN